MTDAADFYTGFVADAYAVLKSETFDAGRYASGGATGPSISLARRSSCSPNDETARRALDAFRLHLAPGGTIMVPPWIPESTPASALGVAREAKDETGALLRFTALSEEMDVQARKRRTRVRYERTSPDGSTESIDRDWLIHWQTPETIRSFAAQAGLAVRALEPEPAPGRSETRPGAEFTAYLCHD